MNKIQTHLRSLSSFSRNFLLHIANRTVNYWHTGTQVHKHILCESLWILNEEVGNYWCVNYIHKRVIIVPYFRYFFLAPEKLQNTIYCSIVYTDLSVKVKACLGKENFWSFWSKSNISISDSFNKKNYWTPKNCITYTLAQARITHKTH